MQWNDDMSMAPAGEEWVMGAILLDEEDPGLGYVYEGVICDGGVWMNSVGLVVNPAAWCRIDEYNPRPRYEWEKHEAFRAAFFELESMMPDGIYVEGLAVANSETGEGALIFDDAPVDLESSVFNADVKKDILGDAQEAYGTAKGLMFDAFKSKRKH